ncbi:hypothetical protein BC831DRAFT_460924 [Entophlyctis helioformis]|nr:hypothetical protein BC831DRAFT_460924 [Entophlyctis helioformis]
MLLPLPLLASAAVCVSVCVSAAAAAASSGGGHGASGLLSHPPASPKPWSLRRSVDAFEASLSKTRLREALRTYTSQPHVAGTKGDEDAAEFTRATWEAAGLPNVHIKPYYPLLNYPISRSLTLLEPARFEASLTEPAIGEDGTSHDENAVPTFLGYSPSGNVTAELVYANFGDPTDFEALASRGIDVKGKIVLVRYGGAFRGLKVRAAELAGAAAVLIYSDPKEDGFVRGPVYPDGPWRPPHAVQRGSIQYPNFYSGDPLTPFVAATEDALRIPIEQANIPKIPALPISYADAKPLLAALEGKGVQASTIDPKWQGGLDLQYWTGPAGKAHLHIDNDFKVKPIWNVLTIIEGAKEPDRSIVFGGHRDAWVYGAVDPCSGASVLLETGVALGRMYQKGWRPDRTIVLASWDGEEYGLLGSTEWVEDHVEILNMTAVAYMNLDSGVSGNRFSASASPSLANLIRDSGKSVYKEWARRSSNGKSTTKPPPVSPLGFGSDFVSFLQHVGVAATDMSFGGNYGVYHSNYDSFHWMEKHGDPKWEYHKTMAKIAGRLVLSLAHLEVLPFEFSSYADELALYTRDVTKALDAANQPQAWGTPLVKAVDAFTKAAHKLDKETRAASASSDNNDDTLSSILGDDPVAAFEKRDADADADADADVGSVLVMQGSDDGDAMMSGVVHAEDATITKGKKHKKPSVREINDKLAFAERKFLDPNGIPGRPWYRHVVYAPGEWTGYAAEMFPAIHEAIRKQDADGTLKAIDVVAYQIQLAADHLAL